MLIEILAKHGKDLVQRCQIIPYGSSSVGQALGQMVASRRFPRASCVFLDGDKSEAIGCQLLPGGDAPERVVFDALRVKGWQGLNQRVGRGFSDLADALGGAMNTSDHHEWVRTAANKLVVSGETLWQAMCAEWADTCLAESDALALVREIQDTLDGVDNRPTPVAATRTAPKEPAPTTRVVIAEPPTPTEPSSSTLQERLSGL